MKYDRYIPTKESIDDVEFFGEKIFDTSLKLYGLSNTKEKKKKHTSVIDLSSIRNI